MTAKSATVLDKPTKLQSTQDLSYLLKTAADTKKPLQSLQVGPRDEKTISLGTYRADKQPKGFVVTCEPNVEHEVVSKLVTQQCGTSSNYEIIAFIANYSSQKVDIKLYNV